MPNLASAKKRMRQDIKRNAYNRSYVSCIRTLSKKTAVLASGGESNLDIMQTALKNAQKVIDRARSKGVLKKKTAARKVSRLSLLCKKAAQQSQQDSPSQTPSQTK